METKETTCPLTKGEHMLVAVDGSMYSDFAVDQAVSLGGLCNSKIYLISVVAIQPENVSDAPDYVDKLTEQHKGYLKKAREKVEAANIPCEPIICTGDNPHELIVRHAREKDVDLIVMGTHGRTGLKNFFLGSVAQKVVACAPCPIMVIPSRR
ncbi:MAG: universal stress protein [Desulfohalobiaceae bacterium]|nr:universal stress protein [Desulfohalobiaceae bacterium]